MPGNVLSITGKNTQKSGRTISEFKHWPLILAFVGLTVCLGLFIFCEKRNRTFRSQVIQSCDGSDLDTSSHEDKDFVDVSIHSPENYNSSRTDKHSINEILETGLHKDENSFDTLKDSKILFLETAQSSSKETAKDKIRNNRKRISCEKLEQNYKHTESEPTRKEKDAIQSQTMRKSPSSYDKRCHSDFKYVKSEGKSKSGKYIRVTHTIGVVRKERSRSKLFDLVN